MGIRVLCAASFAAVASLVATEADATIITIEQTQILDQDGQSMQFVFDLLEPALPGTSAIIRIATGDATLSSDPDDVGLDLGNEDDEVFDLLFDAGAENLGTYTCGAGVGATIPGFTNTGTGPNAASNCVFTLEVVVDSAIFDLAAANSSVIVDLLFGDGVDHRGQGDAVIVSLSYTQIPLPAAAWVFLAGIGGLGFAMRQRKLQHQNVKDLSIVATIATVLKTG